MFDGIDIISDHYDHLQVKVDRYRPVQVIKMVTWWITHFIQDPIYTFDDLNGSIPFHFYLQMVGMIRYAVFVGFWGRARDV